MAAHTLNILKPSVNNLTARIFVRAAGLEFEEVDVWGKKGTLYPLVARATYPTLGFAQYAGEVGSSGADEQLKARAQQDAVDAIADIRLAATLEFLKSIDYDFPQWALDYMAAVEKSLGEAYTEPAADVRAFVGSVTGSAG